MKKILWLGTFLFALTSCSSAPHIRIEWTTASEIDTAGFNVYRGESPNGTVVKINTALIPATKDSVTGGKYFYVDENVEPGRTYYYFLDDIETSGKSERHGPITATTSAPLSAITILLIVLTAAATFIAGIYFFKKRLGVQTHGQV